MEKNSLTRYVNPNNNCDRCSMSLRFSEWNGYLVCLSLGKKKNTGFKCVKCILSKVSINRNSNVTRMKKQLVSEEELDQFVRENKKFLTKAEDYLRCENP